MPSDRRPARLSQRQRITAAAQIRTMARVASSCSPALRPAAVPLAGRAASIAWMHTPRRACVNHKIAGRRQSLLLLLIPKALRPGESCCDLATLTSRSCNAGWPLLKSDLVARRRLPHFDRRRDKESSTSPVDLHAPSAACTTVRSESIELLMQRAAPTSGLAWDTTPCSALRTCAAPADPQLHGTSRLWPFHPEGAASASPTRARLVSGPCRGNESNTARFSVHASLPISISRFPSVPGDLHTGSKLVNRRHELTRSREQFDRNRTDHAGAELFG